MALPPPILVTDAEQLRALVASWQHEPTLACDTESNSLYVYREKVCLFQLSTTTADYVIDPLVVSLEPLRPLLADPAIEKIFHAAEYDIFLLKREFQFEIANLFDTMIAARVTGREKIGLAALLEEFCGVQADKRFQRSDWSQRPIPADQLYYAEQDTHYLFTIHDRLLTELNILDRLTEATELFALQTEALPPDVAFDPSDFWRINGARTLSARQAARLQAVYIWRDSTAAAVDVPPFKIVGDPVLMALAMLNPLSIEQLVNVRGLSPALVRRYGTAILKAITHGNHTPLPVMPELSVLDPLVRARYDALHNWRKQTAAGRGVGSDIVLSKESLWALATNPPAALDDWTRVPGLNNWRRTQYMEALRAVLIAAEHSFYTESASAVDAGALSAESADSTADSAVDSTTVLPD